MDVGVTRSHSPSPPGSRTRPAVPPARPAALTASLFTPRQAGIYRRLVLAWALGALWFWVWWLDPAHFVGWPQFLFATLPLLWLYALQVFFVFVILNGSRTAAPDPAPGQWRVAMIVTKTPSEPFDIVRGTLEAMLAQDYPHDTWLADEDPSPETRAWCKAHGVHISTRKGVDTYHRPVWPRRTRCKEGNLAYFYDHWGYRDYDIVSQLDADHVPQPGYLREMVRPFADPDVGYVSAPSICSANAGESWAARTRLHTEAGFHGLLQAGYNRALTPMCIGSHYAVRTAALRKVGGLGPDLAEDHSTTMILNAGGWRGVHAIDATAIGDGPATVSDLVTQEFQWSRSLVTLLLQHTGRYLRHMPGRLRFHFLFCQLLYPLFALTSAMFYLSPILALSLDIRFADVTYPEFLLHSVPAMAVLTAIAFRMRHDGFYRPKDAPVISWEKALFLLIQWPWVAWGSLMALRDRLTGTFVDFRITPKGASAARTLPVKIIAVYSVLAIGATLPVLLVEDLTHARGFLLLSLLNASLYATILVVIVWHHISAPGVLFHQSRVSSLIQIVAVLGVLGTIGTGITLRGEQGLMALTYGLGPYRLVRAEYGVAGAGVQAKERIYFVWDPGWHRPPVVPQE